MPIDNFIIKVYIFVDDFLKTFGQLRKRGSAPMLGDAEVITMEVVGEFLGLGSDKRIFEYFVHHWKTLFPKIGTRVTFVRQCANLWHVKSEIQKALISALAGEGDIFLFDGMPIPTCNVKRVRHKNPFWGEGGFGYCAAKDYKYFGFKGHILTNQHGVITNFTIAAANIDERDVLPELAIGKRGFVIADKGLIRPELTEWLASHGLNLQTPLRDNMKDSRPKEYINDIMNKRRLVETVIGQLVERFQIQAIRAKDLFHLSVKVGRKILAHTFGFLFAGSTELDSVLA